MQWIPGGERLKDGFHILFISVIFGSAGSLPVHMGFLQLR